MNFGPEYTKIQTIFKRDKKGDKKVIVPGDWTLPEFEYLQDNPWTWTEKVDGTNIRLHWDGTRVTIGGRTDDASLPAALVAALSPLTEDTARWQASFPDCFDVTVYGEGYGGNISKTKGYSEDKKLIVFDVKIGPWWLSDENISDVAAKLGLETVPKLPVATLNEAWNEAIIGGILTSYWKGAKPEGLVGRPAVPLFTRKGERLIVKMKLKDWTDYQRRGASS